MALFPFPPSACGVMSRLKAMPHRLALLPPKVGWMPPKTEAEIDRDRSDRNAGRSWYKTAAWRRLRWSVLLDALFHCARCGANYGHDTAQLVADHKRRHGGDAGLFWARENLQCLCKPCHDSAKQSEERLTAEAMRRAGR